MTGWEARIGRNVNGEYDWPEYHRGSLLIFVFFLGYIVYWYLQGGYRFPSLGAIRFEFLVGTTLSAFAILAYFANPNRERSGVGIWTALLFVVMSIMVWFSYVPDISYDYFIDRVVKFALLGFFIAAFVTTPGRLGWFIGAFLFACLKMGQEGFLGTITGSLMWENQGIPRLHGPTPNYAHPNSFAGMALGYLPFVVCFYGIVPWYLRLVLLVQLVFIFNIILFTGSRTGYVALAIGLGFLVWMSKNRKRAILVALLSGLAVAPLIPHDYIERAQTLVTLEDKEGHSIEKRKELLEDAWRVFVDKPLGVGVHAFQSLKQDRFGVFVDNPEQDRFGVFVDNPDRLKKRQDTHNLYLQIATNLGVQGLIVFGGFILALLRALSRLTAKVSYQIKQVEQALAGVLPAGPHSGHLHEHLQDLRVMRATCLAVYVFLIMRLALGFFGMDLYEIYWWFALGTTVAVWNINVVAQHRTDVLCGSAAFMERGSSRQAHDLRSESPKRPG